MINTPCTKLDNIPSALVVGYGSIGQRHARLLESMGCSVGVVSRRHAVHARCYPTIKAALEARPVNYVVVATETARHRATLAALIEAGYSGLVLVEKPLFDLNDALLDIDTLVIYVGYVLRFSPLLTKLRQLLHEQECLTADVRACSFLPLWRPGRDYRTTGSALKSAGGGVLRDLSHELDYVCWLFGSWQRVAATGGHVSSLEIETDDVCVVLAQTDRCQHVTVSLNYLDRIEERWIIVNTGNTTLRADFVKGALTDSGRVVFESGAFDLDSAIKQQHAAVLSGTRTDCCTFEEGLQVVSMMQAAQRSMDEHIWVVR